MTQKQKVWETAQYYHIAKEANEDLSHPGLQLVAQFAQQAKSVLEVGCGEGSKLHKLVPEETEAVGVDISRKAITLAQQAYPRRQFQVADATQLPFTDNRFDLVFSAFVLEHTQEPEKVIQEMARVVATDGYMLIICPNFGATARRSPCFQGNRFKKLVAGLGKDVLYGLHIGIDKKKLSWLPVKPIAQAQKYAIDWDTTVEPNLITLLPFIEQQKFTVIHADSSWSMKEASEGIMNKVFRALGNLDIYPFKYWGPHLVVVAQKKQSLVKRRMSMLSALLSVLLWVLVFVLPFTPFLVAGLLGFKYWTKKKFSV